MEPSQQRPIHSPVQPNVPPTSEPSKPQAEEPPKTAMGALNAAVYALLTRIPFLNLTNANSDAFAAARTLPKDTSGPTLEAINSARDEAVLEAKISDYQTSLFEGWQLQTLTEAVDKIQGTDEKEHVLRHTLDLVAHGPGVQLALKDNLFMRQLILEIVADLPRDAREDVCKMLKSLFESEGIKKEDFTGMEREKLILILHALPRDRREAFLHDIKTFIQQNRQRTFGRKKQLLEIAVRNMIGEIQGVDVKRELLVSLDEKPQILAFLPGLLKNVEPILHSKLLETFININNRSEDSASILAAAAPLFRNEKGDINIRGMILDELASLEPQNREETLRNLTLQLDGTDPISMIQDQELKSLILLSVMRTPELKEALLKLLEGVNSNDHELFLKRAVGLPKDSRLDILRYAQPLLQGNTNFSNYLNIITFIREIEGNREQFFARLNPLMVGVTNSKDRLQLLYAFKVIFENTTDTNEVVNTVQKILAGIDDPKIKVGIFRLYDRSDTDVFVNLSSLLEGVGEVDMRKKLLDTVLSIEIQKNKEALNLVQASISSETPAQDRLEILNDIIAHLSQE